MYQIVPTKGSGVD